MKPENLFAEADVAAGAEELLTLFENTAVKIVRILSALHQSGPDFWYDQEQDEWVVVLKGRAVLEFEQSEPVEMKEGDFLAIPKHVKHRVRQTSAKTLWLTVHTKMQ
jgi:cupin 2 domain-containing protein